jgi:hypothetical protein
MDEHPLRSAEPANREREGNRNGKRAVSLSGAYRASAAGLSVASLWANMASADESTPPRGISDGRLRCAQRAAEQSAVASPHCGDQLENNSSK